MASTMTGRLPARRGLTITSSSPPIRRSCSPASTIGRRSGAMLPHPDCPARRAVPKACALSESDPPVRPVRLRLRPRPGSVFGDPSCLMKQSLERASAPTNSCNLQTVSDGDYRLMVDALADFAFFMLDAEGHILSWNEGARLLQGYERDEVIGRHFGLFYPADLVVRNRPQVELAVALEHGRFEDEGWRTRKDGSRFLASFVITKVVDDEGKLRGFSHIARDLTEHRRQEDLLRSSEERFRLLVEGVKDYAIFMLDPEGRVISWNLGAQVNKGYAATEIIGKHFSIFYPEEV